MVVKNTRKKSTAKAIARTKRKRGLNATVFKTKKGYAVSVTRGK